MGLERILSELGVPGYRPEWGSGGVFGLTYHRGTLYFTLAFEAENHSSPGTGARCIGSTY